MNWILRLLALLAMFLSLPMVEVCAQQAPLGTGLEIDNYQLVRVLVEDDKAIEQIGLTTDRIRTRVELRLQQARLKLGHRPDRAFLYVNVNVAGHGFAIQLAFKRWVSYLVGNVARQRLASTWDTGRAGTYTKNPEYIIQQLDILLDEFLNEYLKANGQ